MNLTAIVQSWFRQSITTSIKIFKIMIPVSILVKILQETGLIVYIGKALAPLMSVMGLPGEMGLVWASAMLGNIYAGIITYFSIGVSLTSAQITVLSTIILIAHTLPVELAITQKAGVKAGAAFLFRFLLGFFAGIVLYQIYNIFNVYQNIPTGIEKIVAISENATLGAWALSELKNYAIVFCYITGLIIIMDILKRVGIIEKINQWFYPVLKFLGIGKEVIPITVIGMTLGLAYGGGLIINEVQQTKLERRNVCYALLLMSLFHSVVEDSILMISIGAKVSGVFIFRFLFTLLIMYFFVKITQSWSENRMQRWFYSRRKTTV
ncbi:MAG: hypothetical protein FWC10_05190 [Lentimicrobiaceae bacterium]|nr:hypothetical protein [Lentimicrobiaceae bacterium]